MPHTFLVDGHNALHQLCATPPANADAARHLVIERARATLAVRRPTERAHVVFDTSPAGKVRAGTHGRDGAVSWSYADGSADEEIVRLVREGGGRDAGREIVVVTDDRELRGRAIQLGAKAVRVHAWFAAKDAEVERRAERAPGGKALPPLTAADFGFASDAIDLDAVDPDDL